MSHKLGRIKKKKMGKNKASSHVIHGEIMPIGIVVACADESMALSGACHCYLLWHNLSVINRRKRST